MQSIDSFDSKVEKSAELHKVIDSQINAIHELVQMSHELPEGKFLKKFQEMMAVSREESTDNAAYWNHLQLIANELHDGIINKAIQAGYRWTPHGRDKLPEPVLLWLLKYRNHGVHALHKHPYCLQQKTPDCRQTRSKDPGRVCKEI